MQAQKLKDVQLGKYVPVLDSQDEKFGGEVDMEALKGDLDGRYLRLESGSEQTVRSGVHVVGNLNIGGSYSPDELNYVYGKDCLVAGDGGNFAGGRGFPLVSADIATSTLTVLVDESSEYGSTNALRKVYDLAQMRETTGEKKFAEIQLYARSCGALEYNYDAFNTVRMVGVVGPTKFKFDGSEEEHDACVLSVNTVVDCLWENGSPLWNTVNQTTGSLYKVYLMFPLFLHYGCDMGTKVGNGAVALGYGNYAAEDGVAAGLQNYALGRYSIALGMNCRAAKSAVAIGNCANAGAVGAIALCGGNKDAVDHWRRMNNGVVVKAPHAFGWSGDQVAGEVPDYVVPEDRVGTFNIKPVGGLNGVYVGDERMVDQLADRFVDLSSAQTVSGRKKFGGGLVVGGDDIPDLGNTVLGVGSGLTVGANNWYWKCIDLSIDLDAASPSAKTLLTQTRSTGSYPGTFQELSARPDVQGVRAWMQQFRLPDEPIYKARVFLSREQPKYPGPFVIYNGVSSVFRTSGYTIDVDALSTYSKLSASGHLNNAWTGKYGRDYNRFMVEGVDTSDPAKIKAALQKWIREAMTPDAGAKQYGLAEYAPGQTLTIVNSEKTQYYRSMVVESVDESGAVLTVKINPNAADCTLSRGRAAVYSLITYGGGVCDVEPDDSSLVFVDSPAKPAPANTSTYGSVNIGEKNTVIRRCSLAAGKDNRCEGDFSVALGRKAHADHYASFVWAPANEVNSPGTGTFTVGLKTTDIKKAAGWNQPAHKTMHVGCGKKTWPMHRYLLACIIDELKHSKTFRDQLREALDSTEDQLSADVDSDFKTK